jgi:hypothetical protein
MSTFRIVDDWLEFEGVRVAKLLPGLSATFIDRLAETLDAIDENEDTIEKLESRIELLKDDNFRCVECGKHTGDEGEYYLVRNKLWAAAGLRPNGGMLCLAHLERRIGRQLEIKDFTARRPSAEAWQRHLAARTQ